MRSLVISLLSLVFWGWSVLCFAAIKPKPSQVCYKNSCFTVEVAKTDQQRRVGLMYRETLDPDKGMLFFFNQEGDYSFWMKNVKIDLDIIWVDRKHQVVFIAENIKACSSKNCRTISSNKKAKYVLELPSGTVKTIGLKLGDKLLFRMR